MNGSNSQQGCLVAFIRLLLGRGVATGGGPSLSYKKRDYLFSIAERDFYELLRRAVGEGHVVFAKVRLADILYLPKGSANRQAQFNRVQSKHVDFLVCTEGRCQPVFAVELDDSSHQRAPRVERDAFVDSALAAAGLPLLRVPVSARGYNVENLRAQIVGLLKAPTGVEPSA